MKPVLFPSTATAFDSQGIGALVDAISCTVEEERNGAFELTMEFPLEGAHFSDIALRSLILAKPNPTDPPQPFRVYNIDANMNGTVTVNAAHISYDMSGVPIQPFTAATMAEALAAIKANAVIPCPFTLTTNKTVNSPMNHAVPSSMRSLLGGTEGSLLDLYGGEWKYDKYTATLMLHRGEDNGVVIKYGKNLTDLEQEKNCAEAYTGVYPYWVSQDGETVVQLPERIIYAVSNDDYALTTESGADLLTEDGEVLIAEEAPVDADRIMMLDLSQSEEDAREQGEEAAPTVAELREKARAYIDRNDIFAPKVALKVSFEQLENTEEYKDIALLEQVNLCDTVTVLFPALGVSTKAKVVKTTYDVLLDRYESIEVGSARTNIADTIATMQSDIDTNTAENYKSISAAGGSITGDLSVGGSLVVGSRFESNGASVKIKRPAIWAAALGLYYDTVEAEEINGLTVSFAASTIGTLITISGIGTEATTSTGELFIGADAVGGALIDPTTGAQCGYFWIADNLLNITVSTANVSTYGQIFIPGVVL